MTFNQWCAGRRFDAHTRIAVEAIWNAMVGSGMKPTECGRLLADLFASLEEDVF